MLFLFPTAFNKFILTFMTIKKTIVSILLAGGCAMGAFAQNGLNDPMTKAMMEVYDQEITANPQAYDVYFRRANE